jgi:hypothetical protein
MHTVEKICGKIEILSSENIVNHTTKHLTEAIYGLYLTTNFSYIRNILNNLFKDEGNSDLKILKLLLSVQTFSFSFILITKTPMRWLYIYLINK